MQRRTTHFGFAVGAALVIALAARTAAIGRGSESAESPPSGQPASQNMAKNVNFARPANFDTVVPASSPLALAIIVKAKTRTYLFSGDSAVTRTEEHVVIRGYNSIFVFRLGDIKVRRLGTKDLLDLAALPQERDAGLRNTISHAPSDGVRPAADVCPDCVIPVVAGT